MKYEFFVDGVKTTAVNAAHLLNTTYRCLWGALSGERKPSNLYKYTGDAGYDFQIKHTETHSTIYLTSIKNNKQCSKTTKP